MYISYILMRNVNRNNLKTWLKLGLTDYLNQRTIYFQGNYKTEVKSTGLPRAANSGTINTSETNGK